MRNQFSFLTSNKTKNNLKGFFENSFATKPDILDDNAIINKQIEILEDAIRRYERLEDLKKFTKMALEDIDNVTEEDIKRSIELEEKISIDDDIAIKKLLESENLLNDIYGD